MKMFPVYVRFLPCRRIITGFACLIVLTCFLKFNFTAEESYRFTQCAESYTVTDSDIITFAHIYRNRPYAENHGGSRFDNSFTIWTLLRQIQPEFVIESGVYKGHSTWLIRTSLPNARIVSIDRNCPQWRDPSHKTVYFCGDTFIDFGLVEWHKYVKPESTLLYFDDHQSSFKRVFQAVPFGFSKIFFEDNYDVAQGDHQSVRRIIFKEDSDGYYKDNFNSLSSPLTDTTHELLRRAFLSVTSYCEFPPVFSTSLTRQKRYDTLRSVPPIVSDDVKLFMKVQQIIGTTQLEFEEYTYFAYLHIK